MATQFSEVIDSFHSIIMDKRELPESLELMWLKKAVAELSVETSPIEYNEEVGEFNSDIGQYVIDTLALLMKSYYIAREVSTAKICQLTEPTDCRNIQKTNMTLSELKFQR